MKTPKVRELKEALTALVKGPYTTRFPRQPHIPPPAFRGKPEYVAEECVGCGACAEVCPAGAIKVEDRPANGHKPVRALKLHYDHCIFCGTCERNCPTGKGIRLTNAFDLATYDRRGCVETVEKELALCERCGAVVGTVEHLVWTARNLGAKAYANPTLALALHKELGVLEDMPPRPDRPLNRSDHMRVLCPDCRREAVVTEEWG